MAYYYVKLGGTATGDAGRSATKRTGTWNASAADYYDTIYDVYNGVPTTTPVAGDHIIAEDGHAIHHSGAITILPIDGTYIISVDRSNQGVYLKGASETGDNAVTFKTAATYGRLYMAGVTIGGTSNTYIFSQANSNVYCYECTFDLLTTNAGLQLFLNSGDGCYLRAVGCTIKFAVANQHATLGKASRSEFKNLSLAGGMPDILFKSPASYGMSVLIEDSDLSSLTSAVSNFGIQSHDQITLDVNRCLLGAGCTLSSVSIDHPGIELNLTSSAIGSSTDTMDYFLRNRYSGTIDKETAIYRTAAAPNFSAELAANANTSDMAPLEFELLNGVIDTADFTTTVTAKVHFATNDAAMAVDSSKVWMEFEYADGADNALAVIQANRPAPLAAGVAPTTETALWTGLDGTDQQLSMSVSATIGTTAGTIASGVVRVRLYLAGASDTIFGCPQVEFS